MSSARGAIGSALWRLRVSLLVGFGMLCRVAQYLANRSPWGDEASLAWNVLNLTPSQFFGELQGAQLAPPGFLLLEWTVTRGLGPSYFALRLVPLAAGLVAVPLFWRLARRCLEADAAVLALALFVTADELIYFGSEVKQYGPDVALALALALAGLRAGDRPHSGRALAVLAVAGAFAVWFSHPAAFVLAGVGTTLIADALLRREFGRSTRIGAASTLWLISFAFVHAISRVQRGNPRVMSVFWDFAFPPWPPTRPGDLLWWPRHVLYLAINPLDFNTPFGWTFMTVPPIVLGAIGVGSLGRRDPFRFGVVVLPVLSTMLATSLRFYPFHGRLVLFLVPAFLILIAEGAGRVANAIGTRWAWAVVVASLLVFPTVRDLVALAEPRQRTFFNSHGDRDIYGIDPDHFPF